ncbi:hypothetical protein Ac2012v2_007549 [Leucoagaricus gongylophorus]
MKAFPEFAEESYEKLTKLDEDWMKSKEGKKRWREFITSYEKKIKDYNFGSLIRSDARGEYGENNTIFGMFSFHFCCHLAPPQLSLPTSSLDHEAFTKLVLVTRTQFLAVEISRNRLGLNDKAHEFAKAEGEKDRQKAQKEKESVDKEKQRR